MSTKVTTTITKPIPAFPFLFGDPMFPTALLVGFAAELTELLVTDEL